MTFWLTWYENFLQYLPNILTALAIFVLTLLAAKAAEKGIHRLLLVSERSDAHAVVLMGQILRWSIIILGSLSALNRFFDVTAFVAGLGVVGLGVSFALQDILQNLVAGIIILLQNPFSAGEAVEIGGQGGTVNRIDLRATELHTWDGRVMLIPNTKVLGNIIINYSRAQRRRVTVPIGIGYNDDPESARQALLEAVRKVPGLVAEPPPSVIFDTFGDSAVNLNLHFWIDTEKTDIFQARDAAIVQAKAALEAAGIDIPYPIQTIHLASQE